MTVGINPLERSRNEITRRAILTERQRIFYPKIAASSTIVFGTPVYGYGPTALMKAFIDRFVYFNCEAKRPMVRGKRAVVAVVLEEDRAET